MFLCLLCPNHLGYMPPDSFKNIEYLFYSDTLHSLHFSNFYFKKL